MPPRCSLSPVIDDFAATSHPRSEAAVACVRSTAIWFQSASPNLSCNFLCARAQYGLARLSFDWPAAVRRKSRCRRSSPGRSAIQPRFAKGRSIRVRVVLSSASKVPSSPCADSPRMFSAMSRLYCVGSIPVRRSSWSYILVTARAALRRFAQAHGSTGKDPSDNTIYVYTYIVASSSKLAAPNRQQWRRQDR